MATGYFVLPYDLYVWLKKMLFKDKRTKRNKAKAWKKSKLKTRRK